VGERETEFITVGMPGMVTPMGGGVTQYITLEYSPMISLADREEWEGRLVPFIKQALRQM